MLVSASLILNSGLTLKSMGALLLKLVSQTVTRYSYWAATAHSGLGPASSAFGCRQLLLASVSLEVSGPLFGAR